MTSTFAARLRDLRERAGLSQAALAEQANLSRQQVHAYERGDYVPAWDRVCALADALGVDVSEFREQKER